MRKTMKKLRKIFSVIKRCVIKKLIYIDVDIYMKKYTKHLKKIGIDFFGKKKKVKFIAPCAYFDGTDYSLIHIGDNVTISKDVMILTHDYSITTAMCCIGTYIDRNEGELFFKKDIYIGNDSFIGARASLLPGSKIGNNCIVGACAVVKGSVPDNSIVIGNPAKIIGRTDEYAKKHSDKKDYFVEK